MFTWIPFYTELSKKLIEYKDKRDKLVEFIYATEGLGNYTSYLHTSDGKKIDDIDPFSFYGIFNTSNKRNNKTENRIDILKRIKVWFNISADIPSDFDGLPVLNYMHSFYYDWNNVRSTCDVLWGEYEKLMNGSNVDGFFDYYHFNKRHSETTMPLYWMMPNEYIALDTRNREFLQNEYGIETKDSITDFATYKAFCNSLKDKINNKEIRESSISEISYQAYLYCQETTDHNIWFVRWPEEDVFNYCMNERCLYFNNDNKLSNMAELGDNIKTFSKSLGEAKTIKQSTVYYTYWQLSHLVKEDDIIVYFKTKKDILGWGYVTSAYIYDDTKKFHHFIGVGWNKVDIKNSPVKHSSGLWFKDKKYNDVKTLLDKLGIGKGKKASKGMEYILPIEDVIIDACKLLNNTGQIILQGAPGCGKTYITTELAVYLCDGKVAKNQTDNKKRYKELQSQGRVAFTTFHQSLDYEEFVEGLKPVDPKTSNGQMIFEVKDGIFKTICDEAVKRPDEKFVLIIDEINRANISKVLGELITLLEKSKRLGNDDEFTVTLPYSQETFGVPDNLYIIGTMNTADRSLGYIDYAVRRRFGFMTLKSDSTLFATYFKNKFALADKVSKLYIEVKEIIGKNLSNEFEFDDVMIGHSYFMVKSEEEYELNRDYKIKPLLLEYLRDGIILDKEGLKDSINNLK